MSKSKAKKIREKHVRAGRRDPSFNRSPYALMNLATRKTKTKKDHLFRTKHKNRNPNLEENDSFILGILSVHFITENTLEISYNGKRIVFIGGHYE